MQIKLPREIVWPNVRCTVNTAKVAAMSVGRNSAALIAIAVLSAASPFFTTMAVAQRAQPAATADGAVLPFPPVPSASIAAETLQESTHQRRAEPDHLPKDSPNIVIILLDDVGFGLPDTFGGPIHTPTLSKLANEGISYNSFHTTSICSPTRAALLTGRNQTRVGSGTIAERAVDWDGYTGMIPRTSATLAKVLGAYGYKTAAFGKWHNTPATQTTPWGRSIFGQPERVSVSIIFTVFLPAKLRNGSLGCLRTSMLLEPPNDRSII